MPEDKRALSRFGLCGLGSRLRGLAGTSHGAGVGSWPGGLTQSWPCGWVLGLHAQTCSIPQGLFPGFSLVLASPEATWERGEEAPRAEANGFFVNEMSYPVGPKGVDEPSPQPRGAGG